MPDFLVCPSTEQTVTVYFTASHPVRKSAGRHEDATTKWVLGGTKRGLR